MRKTRVNILSWFLRIFTMVFIIVNLTLFTPIVLANLKHMIPALDSKAPRVLLSDDDEFLNIISKKAFNYFWNEANPDTGLIPYNNTADSPCSVAVVGFGLTAIPVGMERGWISREEGYNRVLTTLRTLASDNVQRKHGFFYELLDMKSCKRFKKSTISSMDTCILMSGILFVGEFFPGTVIRNLANKLYTSVDWQWMGDGKTTLAKNWTPESGFSTERWDSFDESLLMYVLALGSPTYPLPAQIWDEIRRPVRENYISVPKEDFSSYVLPHVWLNLRGKEDYYANYWNNVLIAARYNRIYSILNHNESKVRNPDIWGLSKCEGVNGYRVYGASAGNHDDTFTPYAPISCIPFIPDKSIQAIRAILMEHGGDLWGEYGFTSGYTWNGTWHSGTHYGIDEGMAVLMIENYRTGFVWKYLTSNNFIQAGLDRIGFRASKMKEAVTPIYLSETEGKHYQWSF